MLNNDNYTDVQRKIVEAARHLFVKKGIKGTTVRDIAKVADVNVAMVNYYFRSKENLFATIFDEAFGILSERIFYLIDADLPFFELIRRWVYSYYDLLWEYPDLPIFVLNELAKNPHILDDKFKLKDPYQLYVKLAFRIREEEKKGLIHPVPVSDFLLNIISLSIFPFAAKPVVTQFLHLSDTQYMDLASKHKEYVADFIIRAIKVEK
ncbi:MAG: TetR/AcrR family transcriptional regulator [Prevotella sp.]|jgi:AcrR family transcriptional regulator|nr:TetR/AcrR family transcriptional regulator [Prevotella sp.]